MQGEIRRPEPMTTVLILIVLVALALIFVLFWVLR